MSFVILSVSYPVLVSIFLFFSLSILLAALRVSQRKKLVSSRYYLYTNCHTPNCSPHSFVHPVLVAPLCIIDYFLSVCCLLAWQSLLTDRCETLHTVFDRSLNPLIVFCRLHTLYAISEKNFTTHIFFSLFFAILRTFR